MAERLMKESGIDWIREIPHDWKIERNKNCFSCSKEIVGSKWKETQLLSLTTKGIKKKSYDDITGKIPDDFGTYQTVEPNDNVMCLFDLDVSAVFSGISSYKGMISPAYKVLKVKENMNPKFADYWFMYVFDERKFKTYSKNIRYTLNYDEFATLPIVCPQIEEQIRIANFLDKKVSEIDNAVEKTKQSIEEYKKLKQSIITEVVIKGLNPDVEMKDSGVEWFGEIPENWNVYQIKYLTSNIFDIDHYMPGDSDALDSIPYLMIGDLKENLSEVKLAQCKRVSMDDYRLLSKKGKIDKGDIVFARYATIGTAMYVDIDIECLISYACLSIKCNNLCFGKFLYYCIKSNSFIEEAKRFINSNTQGNIGKESLLNMRVVLPNKEEQEQIVQYLDLRCCKFDMLIKSKEQVIIELEQYKKSLIYEYVTGKKEVPNA